MAEKTTKRIETVGSIYLIHFSRPFKHARHYIGWTLDVDRRVGQEHMNGHARSNPLVKAALADGINLTLAKVWEGKTKNDERRLKNRGGASRCCPICQEEVRAKAS
jgi:hypothetical protein